MIRNKLLAVLLTGVIVLNTPLAAFAATEQQRSDSVHGAVDYLKTQQSAVDGGIKDGAFGDVSDWAIVAVEAADLDPANVKTKSGTSLEDYSKENKPDADVPKTLLTTVEKKMISIKASGKDTANFEGVKYDEMLASKKNDGQFGDKTALNDDYFGILASEGTKNESLINLAESSLKFVIDNQASDGGFSYVTGGSSDSNDTSAAIQAMYAAERMGITHDKLDTSRDGAVIYLLKLQNADGGFRYSTDFGVSDTGSTAWALMALNLVGDSVKPQALRAQDWLLRVQNSDGGFRNQIAPCAANDQWCSNLSDAYATSHAIIALLGSSWSLNPEPLELMPLSKPVFSNNIFFNNIQSEIIKEAKTDLTSFASASSAASRFTLAAKNAQQENFKIAATDSPSNKKVAAKESNLSVIGLSVLAAFALGWFAWFMVKSKQTGGSNV